MSNKNGFDEWFVLLHRRAKAAGVRLNPDLDYRSFYENKLTPSEALEQLEKGTAHG